MYLCYNRYFWQRTLQQVEIIYLKITETIESFNFIIEMFDQINSKSEGVTMDFGTDSLIKTLTVYVCLTTKLPLTYFSVFTIIKVI